MSKTLTLSLDPALGADAASEILDKVRALPEVSEAGLIAPDSKTAFGRSLGYARLQPDIPEEQAAKQVAAIDGVVACDVPAKRFAQ
jgi:hypothetical protein